MYILTRSGRQFDFLNPQPDAVAIEDIAHALSHINRFTGHTKYAYSVAQHSIAVSRYLERTEASVEVQFAGLMHDAHEAYFGDISTPLKSVLPIREFEDRIQAVVGAAFGLTLAQMHDRRVKLADLTALAIEAEHLMPPDAVAWDYLAPVTPEMRQCMDIPEPLQAHQAARAFFTRFNELQVARCRRLMQKQNA